MDTKKIIAGAVSGFVAALLVDIHAWQTSGVSAFDWKIASQRWIAGAVSGAIAAMGISATQIPN